MKENNVTINELIAQVQTAMKEGGYSDRAVYCILRRPTDMGAFSDGQCAFPPDGQNDIIPRCS